MAQRAWAEYLGVHDFQPYDGKSDRILEAGSAGLRKLIALWLIG
jgi:hypothetical protein